MTFFPHMTLPGFKFTIWLGWVTGLILTRTPENIKELKSWISAYTLLPLVSSACMVIFAVDFIVNIMPANVRDRHNGNIATKNLGLGFAAVRVLVIAITRVYFLVQAKEVSSFLENVENKYGFKAESSNKYRKAGSIRLLLIFLTAFAQAIIFSLGFHQMDKEQSWFNGVGTYAHTIVAHVIISWPASMMHVTTFSIATTTLDLLLEMLDGFCENVRTLLSRQTHSHPGCLFDEKAQEPGVRPRTGLNQKDRNCTHARSLMESFEKLQSLFLKYNELIGPLVLIMIIEIALGTIDGISDLLKPKDATFTVSFGWYRLTSLSKYAIHVTILGTGVRCKNVVNGKI